VDGFTKLDGSVNQGFSGVKNTLGGISNSLENSRGMLGGISNGIGVGNNTLRGMSNLLSGLPTDYEKNTNNIFSIRQNTSNTVELLHSVTSLLARAGQTNTANTNTAGMDTMGTDAAASTKTSLDALTASVPGSGGTVPGGGMSWVVNGGGFSFDLNPLNGTFGSFAAWARHAFLWVLTLGYVLWVIKEVLGAMYAGPSAQQAGSASVVPGLSSGSALVMAGAMTVALATIPAVAVTTLGGGLFSVLGISIFTGATGPIAEGCAVANAFFPVEESITYALAGLTFKFTLASVFWVATTLVRFLVGGFILFAGISAMEAVQLEIENRYSIAMQVGVGASTVVQPLAGYWIASGGSLKLENVDDTGALYWGQSWGDPSGGSMAIADMLTGTVDAEWVKVFIVEDSSSPVPILATTAGRSPVQWFQYGFIVALGWLGFNIALRTVRKIATQTPEV